jgi:hypothetical protein
MNGKWIITTAFLAAISIPLTGRGQDVPLPPDDTDGPFPGDVGGYGDGMVSTEIGSGLYGFGKFASGMGEYNLNTARAMSELQLARKRAIENHKLAVETWYDLKRQNRQFRAKELDPLTPEQLSRVIESQRPDRLAVYEYNPATGSLTWPVALQGASFESERESLEYAFSTRTSRDSGAGSAFHTQVRRTTETMLAKLKDRIDLFSPNEFIAAKKFLTGLRYESLSPSNAAELAMR